MSSRRAFLTTGGAVLGTVLAGCSTSDEVDPPAGSLRFSNRHDLPHEVRLSVTDTGAERGEDRGTVTGDPETVPGIPFTTTAQLEPETEQVFEDVFTESVYYAAHHTVDGAEPANSQAGFAFNPAPSDRENTSFLEVQIDSSGVFGWVINTTENPGPFDS